MGKLVGLISSGIGLAIEAAAEYQSSSGKSVRKQAKSSYQSDLTFDSRDVLSNENPDQRDEKAFQELQNYADFQRVLSNKVHQDILRDETYTPIDPQILEQNEAFDGYFSHSPYIHPSLQQQSSQGRLLYPVIIPQRRPEDKSRGWVRAYAPALEECGIDQSTFLDFLDSFNEASKSSPYLDVVNVAAMGVGFAPGITPMVISMAVPVAVRLSKTAQTERQSSSFLRRTNRDLFAPRGLFAMVMTYKPDQASQTYTADISQPAPIRTDSIRNTFVEPQLPDGAPLIFPEPTTSPAGQQNKLRQIGHFIADYGDRRAQARYAFNNPDSALTTAPAPTFRSRWADPTHPANNSGLVSMISGIPKDRENGDTSRRGRKEASKRRRKSSSAPLRTDNSLASPSGKASRNGNREVTRRPTLIGSARSMINGPGKENQSLIKGLKGMGMKTDVLYLMIVNNTTEEEVTTEAQRTQMPYRGDKRVKSEDPFEQPWSPDLGAKMLHGDFFDDPMEDRSEVERRGPPPAYMPQTPTRYHKARREQMYCVPTL